MRADDERDLPFERVTEGGWRLLAEISDTPPQPRDIDAALQRVAELNVPRFADLCTIGLPENGRIRRVAIAHIDAREGAALRALDEREPLTRGGGSALAEVAATGAMLYRPIVDAPGPDEPWPRSDDGATNRSLVVTPLVGERGVLGACAMVSFTRRFGPDDVAFAQEIARRCGAVVETALTLRESEDARSRLALLARVGEELSSTFDVGDSARRLLDRMVPLIADFGAVVLRDRDTYRLVELRHVDAHAVPLVQEEHFATDIDLDSSTPIARALRTGVPVLRESLVAVPLTGVGGADAARGALVLGFTGGRKYSAADLPLALDIARRLSLAVERAEAYSAERQIAETLQRSLLPDELPDVATMELCARYLPGGRATVGGDWYDVVPLPHGRIALVIGDVAGHGVRAAAAMGLLRNALRAFAGEGYEPHTMVERLNRFLFENGPRDMATLCFTVIDPMTGDVVSVSAGHPPSLIMRSNRRVEWVDGVSGPPVGADPHVRYRVLRASLTQADTLVMYTDGLIERRGESLDDGLVRLGGAVAGLPDGTTVDELCDHLTTSLLDGGSGDDVAVLVARYLGSAPGTFRWRRPARASELSRLRRMLAGWLERLDVVPADVDVMLVVVSEAVTNSVEHAYSQVEGWVEVEGRLQDRDLTIVVRDGGRWRPKAGGGGGRGLLLIGRLMDEFELRRADKGTELWMRRRVQERAGT